MIASLIRYNIRVAIKKLHEFAAYLNLDLPPELLPKPIRKAKDEAKLVAAKDALIELGVAAPRPPSEVPAKAPSEVPAEAPAEVPAEAPAEVLDADEPLSGGGVVMSTCMLGEVPDADAPLREEPAEVPADAEDADDLT